MSYWRLHLSLQIHGTFGTVSSLDVFMDRYVDLPFLPMPGLTLILGEKFGGDEVTLDKLHWDTEKSEFIHYQEDKELYDKALRTPMMPAEDPERLAEIVALYEEAGWMKRPMKRLKHAKT